MTIGMVKCGDNFEVRNEFLDTIYMSFGFKGLTSLSGVINCISSCFLVYLTTLCFYIRSVQSNQEKFRALFLPQII
jgi:hypothetical protein